MTPGMPPITPHAPGHLSSHRQAEHVILTKPLTP
jgi:hypothetical protein